MTRTDTEAARSAGTRVRLSPETRREQLIALGLRLLATRALDELTTDLLAEEAGISRGLLYHYFDNLQGFHLAVVRAAVDDLVAVTAPGQGTDVVALLTGSLEAYVDYVLANRTGYQSLLRAAAGGNPEMQAIYAEARASLTDRMFDTVGGEGMTALGHTDTPAARLLVQGWSVLVESVVLSWVDDDHAMTKDQLLASITGSLFGILAAAP